VNLVLKKPQISIPNGIWTSKRQPRFSSKAQTKFVLTTPLELGSRPHIPSTAKSCRTNQGKNKKCTKKQKVECRRPGGRRTERTKNINATHQGVQNICRINAMLSGAAWNP
jgi:hypothetical protein